MSRTIISSIVMLAMVLSSVMGTAVAADPVTMAQVYAYAKAGNLQALSSLKKAAILWKRLISTVIRPFVVLFG